MSTMSVYYERENKKMADEAKAVEKQIADTALAGLTESQAQIGNNYGDAVRSAYVQKNQIDKGLNSESSLIANRANTERIRNQLERDKKNTLADIDIAKQGVQANSLQRQADIDSNFDTSATLRDLAYLDDEKKRAREQATKEAKQKEGLLEQLQEISKQNNYEYDFDADIFNLKQQGYTSSDWQIQYLQEAKRLQTLAKKAAKASNVKSQNNNDNNIIAPGDAEKDTKLSNTLPVEEKTLILEGNVKKRAEELRDAPVESLPKVVQNAVIRETNNYYNGEITLDELDNRLRDIGVYRDSDGEVRSLYYI